MSEIAQKMSALFDIDFGSSLETEESSDYGSNVESKHTSFDEKIKDITNVLEPTVKTKPKTLVEERLKKNIEIIEPKIETVKLVMENIEKNQDQSNPLELSGVMLEAFKKIKSDYPQFNLYNGNPAFKDFYQHKIMFLKTVLSRFPVLDFKEMSKELREIRLDHFIGQDANPDLIRVKMDSSYSWRVRLSSMMIDVYEQCFVWERWLDMLKSKLWKDHSMKGAHNREGLTAEHLADVEEYVALTNGFKESTKHIDSMLKAAADSLSRQVTCLQLKEHGGLKNDPVDLNKVDEDLKQFDEISDGSVIKAPDRSSVLKTNFGVSSAEDDDLASLG